MKKLENTLIINKKRLEIRLDPETSELIDTLIARTNLTKSSLIKTALKVYASTLKNGHIYTIRYKTEKCCSDPDNKNNETLSSYEDKRTFNEILEDLDK